MAKGTYLGDDITIILTWEEIVGLGLLYLDENAQKDKRLFHKPLDVLLETEEGSTIVAKVQLEKFDDLGDGIKVDRTDYGFLVRINNEANWRIRTHPSYGTRYEGSNKINFYRKK